MRMSELSVRTGVPVPTIKYYLREGLLPAGERTSPNQARYAEPHVRRLKLIRAMMEVGGLSVAAVRTVVAAVDAPGHSMHRVMGVAQSAVTRPHAAEDSAERQRAELRVAELVKQRGWRVKENNPAWSLLVQVLAALHALGGDDLVELIDVYADVAERLAGAELDVVRRRTDADAKVEGAVLGVVFGDAAMSSLRRLAQEEVSRRAQAHRLGK